MSQEVNFDQMMQRLRLGEPRTVEQFFAKYEPFIRRAVRRSLNQSGLRAVTDSTDVCQSVMASFLIRIAAGEFEIADPSGMEGLLITITRRRLAMLNRREMSQMRDRRRQTLWDSQLEPVDHPHTDPAKAAELIDILQKVRERLSERERRLFDLRRQGHEWDAIATLVAEKSVVLRKQLSRALKRVANELGLESES